MLSRCSVLPLLTCLFLSSPQLAAAPAWVLTYGRQYGEHMTGGVAGQTELFSHDDRGRPVRVGMTNRANAGFAVFGQTDTFGNSRVTFDINNRMYDFHVYDPPRPSESSPDCFWLDSLPHYGHYRFEFHWRLVPDPEQIQTFPFEPAYHYDLVEGFNQAPNQEVSGFSTDAYGLTDWADYQAQTFVVPAEQNRIIAAKAFCVRQHGTRFTMRATIRQGGPTGPQIGRSVVSREVFSNEFPNVLVTWGNDDVPVVPGQTYALRLESTDGQGFNVYATNSNTYRDGMLYNGPQAVSGRDMIGVVIGLGIQSGIMIKRGDCNQDTNIDLADAIRGLGYLFLGEQVTCLDACDMDDQGSVDIADPIYLLAHLFANGPAPPPPYPACGADETEDELTCETSACP